MPLKTSLTLPGVGTGGSPLPPQFSGARWDKVDEEFDSPNAALCFSQEDEADGIRVFQAEIRKFSRQMVGITWMRAGSQRGQHKTFSTSTFRAQSPPGNPDPIAIRVNSAAGFQGSGISPGFLPHQPQTLSGILLKHARLELTLHSSIYK